METLSRKKPQVKPFYGIHPWWSEEWTPQARQELEQYLMENPEAGVGEVGLDRHKGPLFSQQKQAFIQQLELARRYNRPVNLHCVKAWGPMVEILEDQKVGVPLLFHGYSGSPEMVERLIRLGGYISFAPFSLTEKNRKGRRALKEVPRERLLLDSDFPYRRGQPFSEYTPIMEAHLTQGAALRGISPKELTQILEENTRNFLAG